MFLGVVYLGIAALGVRRWAHRRRSRGIGADRFSLLVFVCDRVCDVGTVYAYGEGGEVGMDVA